MEYESLVECESPAYAGVRYKVRRHRRLRGASSC